MERARRILCLFVHDGCADRGAVDGAPPGLDLRASFQGGRRTGVFAVPDTAKILAVRQLGTLLLEIPVELRAGQLNVIRH